MFLRILVSVFIFVGIVGGAWVFVFVDDRVTSPEVPIEIHLRGGTGTTPKEKVVLQESPVPQKPGQEISNGISHDVPFVSQAPTGRWDDPRQQDGCEEAASYMAILWARGEMPPTTASGVEQKLLEISDWEEKEFGDYHDTSVEDTAERIFKNYFKYENVEVGYDIDAEDIKRELYDGNIVVVPADGRKLNNPYFTAPGPERHALLIRGYDPGSDEFITNDNGTKRGNGYRYKTSVLMSAIIDYPTGDHVPIQDETKAMIVVRTDK